MRFFFLEFFKNIGKVIRRWNEMNLESSCSSIEQMNPSVVDCFETDEDGKNETNIKTSKHSCYHTECLSNDSYFKKKKKKNNIQ